MSNSFSCPLFKGALSFEAGLRRRLCCHDETGECQEFSTDLNGFSILKNVIDSSNTGDIPKNCQGCFKIEEAGGFSPRNYYESFFSASEYEEGLLKYVDITFENNCNLSCFTCKPMYSNKVEKEFKKLNIPSENKSLNASEFKNNFNKINNYILDNIARDALVVISGGEPSLSSNVQSFIEQLSSLENSSTFTLRVFSNLTKSADWILDYVDSFKRVEFIISIDAIEERAEYIRFPSKWDMIDKNYKDLSKKCLENSNLYVSVHSVLSILNFDHLPSLIEYFYSSDLKLFPEFTVLSSPAFYQIDNLEEERITHIRDQILNYLDNKDFTVVKDKLKYLVNTLNSISSSENSLMMELIVHHKKLDTLRKRTLLEEIPYLKK